MSGTKLVTVIIPCFNENKRIIPVVKEVNKSELVEKIIIVDDGSSKSTKNVLKKIKNQKIKIITHSQNMGKADALKSGLLASNTDTVVFLDADLIDFKAGNLDSLIRPIFYKGFDMVISDRENESWLSRVIGYSLAFTGDRAIKKKILTDNLSVFNSKNYLIEASINQLFFNKMKIAKVKFDGVSQYFKYKKNGLFSGFYRDLKMFFSIYKYLGVFRLLQQLYYAKKLPYYRE